MVRPRIDAPYLMMAPPPRKPTPTTTCDATRVTFDWTDDQGPHQAGHVFAATAQGQAAAWDVPTGRGVRTRWVEFEPAAP